MLTETSAKFLPEGYRTEFERLTGAKINQKLGIAVPGITITKSGNTQTVKMNFKQALARLVGHPPRVPLGDFCLGLRPR